MVNTGLGVTLDNICRSLLTSLLQKHPAQHQEETSPSDPECNTCSGPGSGHSFFNYSNSLLAGLPASSSDLWRSFRMQEPNCSSTSLNSPTMHRSSAPFTGCQRPSESSSRHCYWPPVLWIRPFNGMYCNVKNNEGHRRSTLWRQLVYVCVICDSLHKTCDMSAHR